MILVYLQEKNEPKEYLQGVSIALLCYDFLRAIEVRMIQMDCVEVESISS